MQACERVGNKKELLEWAKWVCDRGIPRVYPQLAAVMSQIESKTSYVVRGLLDEPKDVEAWLTQAKQITKQP
jgi:hypothetical protein